ncbi:MAG: Fic family protein [bacterium]
MWVRAACFTQDKADDTFRDMKSFEGPLGSLLEWVFDFINRNTPTVSKFNKSDLRRHDEQLYPSEAIREGLVNAFAHRDYADFAGGIAVYIYPMRLEIWNPGCLPAGITPGTLTTGHLSVLRNPDIAHVLYLRGFMEKLGRGSVMILKACKDRGLPAPMWASDEESGVTLTFFLPQVGTKMARSGTEVTPEVAPEVKPEVMRLLAVLKGSMDRKSLQAALGLKAEKNFRLLYLRPAIDSGLIEMTIPDKPHSSKQKYRLTAKGQQALDKRRVE